MLEAPKGWKEFCSLAGIAILKFETDWNKPLVVTIFADRTTCRTSLWIASFECDGICYERLLPGCADDPEAYEDSILCRMLHLIESSDEESPYYTRYFKPYWYKNFKIIREIESERTIRHGLDKELKWAEFPEEIKVFFDTLSARNCNNQNKQVC